SRCRSSQQGGHYDQPGQTWADQAGAVSFHGDSVGIVSRQRRCRGFLRRLAPFYCTCGGR
ncbi:MAG: hypothetical protein VB855_04000, partial [Pirellulaceae bacterium]